MRQDDSSKLKGHISQSKEGKWEDAFRACLEWSWERIGERDRNFLRAGRETEKDQRNGGWACTEWWGIWEKTFGLT